VESFKISISAAANHAGSLSHTHSLSEKAVSGVLAPFLLVLFLVLLTYNEVIYMLLGG